MMRVIITLALLFATPAFAEVDSVARGLAARAKDASNISSGTLDAARLPSVVTRDDTSSTFSAQKIFSVVPRFPLTGYVKGNGVGVDPTASPTIPAGDLSGTLWGVTASQFAATNVASSINRILTSGYATAFDGGEGCLWTRATISAPGALQSADGAYWALSRNSAIDVKCLGALGTGNNSTQIAAAAAIAKSQSASSYGQIAFGNKETSYTLDSGVVMPNAQQWDGCSAGSARLAYTPTSGPAITMIGTLSGLKCFTITKSGTRGTSVGVQLGNGELGQQPFIRDAYVAGFDTNLDVVSNATQELQNVVAQDFTTFGIRWRNTANPDAGDAHMSGVTVENASGVGSALVSHETGGGMKVVGFKGLGSQIGWLLSVPDGAATQDFQFVGNSIENSSVACMKFQRSGTTGFYGNVTINGSEFAGCPTGLWFANAGVQGAAVTGNAFSGISGPAIRLDNGADYMTVGRNIFSVLNPIQDNRNDFAENGYLDRDVTRSVPGITSTTVYQNFWKISVPAFRAAKIEVYFEGTLAGVGSFSRLEEFMIRNDGVTLQLTSLRSVSDGVVIDYQADTATTAGSVYIGVKRNAGAGGTAVNATATLKTSGKIKEVITQ